MTTANLERHGVAAPSAGGRITTWHTKRLMTALERDRHVASAPRSEMTLSALAEAYLTSLDCTVGMKERRKRVLRRVKKETIRRTYWSLLNEAGYSLDQIAEFLGHSDLNTTRVWYARLAARPTD